METKSRKGSLAAVGAFLVIFVNIGVATTLGVFIAQLAAYSGWPVATCVIIGTINTICNILLSLVAVPLAKKIGYKWIMLIAVLAAAAHVNLYTLATPGQKVGTLVCYYLGGALASVAIAFGSHGICSGLIAQWYKLSAQRDKVTSIVTAGASFGAAIWVFLAGQLFKYFTWQQCYRVITVIALVIGLIGVLGLVRSPKKEEEEALEAAAAKVSAQETAGPAELPGVTHKQALKTPSFWLLVIGILCSVTACSAFLSYAAAYWQGMGMDPTTSSNWSAAYLLVAAVFGVLAGFLFKKIKNTGYTLVTHIAMILSFIFLIIWGRSGGNIAVLLAVITYGISYPIDAAFPTLVAHGSFGPKDIAAIIGTLMAAIYAGQLISSLITASILAAVGSWEILWTIFAIVSVIGMIFCTLSIAVSPMKKIEKQQRLAQQNK